MGSRVNNLSNENQDLRSEGSQAKGAIKVFEYRFNCATKHIQSQDKELAEQRCLIREYEGQLQTIHNEQRSFKSTYLDEAASLKQQIREEHAAAMSAKRGEEKLSDSVTCLTVQAFAAEQRYTAELRAEQIKIEKTDHNMLFEASCQQEPLSRMFKQSIATSKTLNEGNAALHVRFKQLELKHSVHCQTTHINDQSLQTKADALDSDKRLLQCSCDPEMSTATSLRLTLPQTESQLHASESRGKELTSTLDRSMLKCLDASSAPSGHNPECRRKCEEFEAELRQAQEELQHEKESV